MRTRATVQGKFAATILLVSAMTAVLVMSMVAAAADRLEEQEEPTGNLPAAAAKREMRVLFFLHSFIDATKHFLMPMLEERGITLRARGFYRAAVWPPDRIEAAFRGVNAPERTIASVKMVNQQSHDAFLEQVSPLNEKPWDFLIYQAYSGQAYVDPSFDGDFDLWQKIVVEEVKAHSPDVKILLHAHWAWRKGWDYNEKQDFITALYRYRARKYGGTVIPVGEAWRIAFERRPEITLHLSETDYHAGARGGYLNSCVIYTVITGEKFTGFKDDATLDRALSSYASHHKHDKDPTITRDQMRFLEDVAWEACQNEIEEAGKPSYGMKEVRPTRWPEHRGKSPSRGER